MKTISTILLGLLFASWSYAALQGIPFLPEVDQRFSNNEAKMSLSGDVVNTSAGVATIQAGAVTESKLYGAVNDGLNAKRTLRATWDATTMGASSAATSLGQALPANAIITDSYFYVVTQTTGSSLIGFFCEDSNNILTPVNLQTDAAGTIFSGKQYGGNSSEHSAFHGTAAIAAACNVSVKVLNAPATAGKIIVFIDYVISL